MRRSPAASPPGRPRRPRPPPVCSDAMPRSSGRPPRARSCGSGRAARRAPAAGASVPGMNVHATGAAVEPAAAADADAIERLLEAAGLPTGGVREALAGFVGVRDGTGIVAVAGIERYGDDVLLRSVAVAAAARRAGLGARLVDERLARAVATGAGDAYLLTTTADGFFRRLGFVAIDRAEVPAGIRASAEFTSLCPANAVVMHRPLVAAPPR